MGVGFGLHGAWRAIALAVVLVVAVGLVAGASAEPAFATGPLAAAGDASAGSAAAQIAAPQASGQAPASEVGVQKASEKNPAGKPAKKKAKKKAGKWKERGGYFYYVKPDGKRARGLCKIGKKTYLFDKSGRQKTGWQLHGGEYRYFKVANGPKGKMLKDRTVNGIRLRKSGKAKVLPGNTDELSLMLTAQRLVEQLTVPAQGKREKLKRGFDWMRYDCVERGLRDFSYHPGWHRTFAHDILDAHTGSCFSYGAAFAYYANAVGCKSCAAVSSGGHGWAEVNGEVYDVEWTRVTGFEYFAFPYEASGGGSPNYAASRAYVVQVAPNTDVWR